MNAPFNQPELLPLGVDGVLVRFAQVLSEDANTRAVMFREQVEAASLNGVTEVASSLVSVLVCFDPARTTRAEVVAALKMLAAEPAKTDATPKRVWHIPVAFGPDYAPQLGEVAHLAGLTQQQVAAQITQTRVRVLAIGFAPGQPYLGMLPPALDIPRQTALTDGTPRGALICAVRQLIIWAADAPTGWRHVGQTAFRVYLPETATPFAFDPGDAVQFHATADDAFADIQRDTTSNGGATCEVLR
jgi:KipI family sensor histidine kinase inhibitor